MSPMQHAFSEHSIVGSVIKLAQTTFFDSLPANAEMKMPTAPEKMPAKRVAREGRLSRWLNRLDNWFYRQQVKQREAYLAQSQDIFELEARIRHLDRRPYY
jgi:Protein of unknown function (DUF3563)